MITGTLAALALRTRPLAALALTGVSTSTSMPWVSMFSTCEACSASLAFEDCASTSIPSLRGLLLEERLVGVAPAELVVVGHDEPHLELLALGVRALEAGQREPAGRRRPPTKRLAARRSKRREFGSLGYAVMARSPNS